MLFVGHPQSDSPHDSTVAITSLPAGRIWLRWNLRFGSDVCVTFRRVPTLTIRTDAEVERALESLTRRGVSRSEAARTAILEADRAHRRATLRAEAESLCNDPEDVAASRELAAEMDANRAW